MRTATIAMLLFSAGVLVGCGPVKVDFAAIEKPAPPPELEKYNDFVGTWNFEAERTVPDGEPEKWTGTSKWEWTLGNTYLRGTMEVTGPKTFSAEGFWGWHPTRKVYTWGMLNDWGYPQWGTAKYYDKCNCWCMNYKGVGLDGTNSWGTYCLKMVDKDKMEWCWNEWADAFHLVKKIEMKGTYTRK